jgi:hypothetical protein
MQRKAMRRKPMRRRWHNGLSNWAHWFLTKPIAVNWQSAERGSIKEAAPVMTGYSGDQKGIRIGRLKVKIDDGILFIVMKT